MSRLLKALADKFTIESEPLPITLSPEVVLLTYPISGVAQQWVDQEVDHTNRLTVVHSIAPRIVAMATAALADPIDPRRITPIYEELHADLEKLGLKSEELQKMHFCQWPFVLRRECAEALLAYLSKLPSTLLDAAYTFYLQNIETTAIRKDLEDLEKAAVEEIGKEKSRQEEATQVSASTSEPTPPPRADLPDPDEVPGVQSASPQDIAGGK